MSDDQDQRQDGSDVDPEARTLSGHPDTPPEHADHNLDNDRELLSRGQGDERTGSGQPAPDGEGGSNQPGTTLPGYG